MLDAGTLDSVCRWCRRHANWGCPVRPRFIPAKWRSVPAGTLCAGGFVCTAKSVSRWGLRPSFPGLSQNVQGGDKSRRASLDRENRDGCFPGFQELLRRGKWGTSRLSPLYCRPRFIVVVPALLSSPLYCPVPALLSPALLSPLYSPSAESVKRLREMRTVLAQSTSIVEASRFHPRRMTLWPRRRATDRFVQERLHSPGLVSHCPYS